VTVPPELRAALADYLYGGPAPRVETLSKREMFAAAAMIGYLSTAIDRDYATSDVAAWAVAQADRLIEALAAPVVRTGGLKP